MKIISKQFILLLFLFGVLGLRLAIAQKNDSITSISLKQVEICESVFTNKISGITIQRVDSFCLKQSESGTVGNLIGSLTPVYIKSYGSSGLSTISFRGTSAGHTGIYWNNIPLNSPTLGLSNLNLLPVFFAQTIDIQHGGASSLLGSGSIGGSIHVNTYPVFKNAFAIYLTEETGSFANYASQANAIVSGEKWYVSMGMQYRQIKNDFPFTNTADVDKPLQRQTNADIQQYGIMQSVYYKINETQFIGSTIWYQNTKAGVPTLMTASESKARQNDESLKAMAEWKKYTKTVAYHFQCAYTNDMSSYTDSSINLASIVLSQLYFTQANATFTVLKHDKLHTGLNLQNNTADVMYYEHIQNRMQAAAFASYMHFFQKINWKMSLNIRQELIRNYKVPFAPSLGLEGQIWKSIYAQINMSRNFNVPTLNNLYWVPGGNPNLLPESGWSEEAGFVLKNNPSSNKFTTNTSIVYYSSVIDNWIQWLPEENSTYWSAQNAKKVWARGIELFSNNKLLIGQNKYELNIGYTFSKSTNSLETTENVQSVGKQLIYVPLHNANGELRILYRGSFISYTQNFVGTRYTTTDNLQSIPFYSLGNIAIGTKYAVKKFLFSVLFKINNIGNVSYQAVEWMAMPGRNYQLALKIHFNTTH